MRQGRTPNRSCRTGWPIPARCALLLGLLLVLGGTAPRPARATQGRVFTLWPLVDYRSSPQTGYRALHLLGPLFKWEAAGAEREWALRPLFFTARAPRRSRSDLLFPLVRGASGSGFTSLNSLSLLEGEDRKEKAGGGGSFMLFPFLFYDRHAGRETSAAFFPVGGRLVGRFKRDDIRFALFPLYSRTRKGSTTVDNVLWPFFARVHGENETGLKVWPLFGFSEKPGVYRKRFFLWPLFFANDLDLDSDNPRHQRACFPLFSFDTSPRQDTRVFFWPLFSFRHDRENRYKRWDFPWPLLGLTRGEDRYGNRFLPLFSDERRPGYRKRWLLWPLYRYQASEDAQLEVRRHSVLFFLYRDLRESVPGEPGVRRRRILLWPLLRYQQLQGVSHLSLLALVEPIFPESDGVEHNWAPLWRLYQAKWDGHGNRVDSLLWNLFWQERRPDAVAMELFPLFRWQAGTGRPTDLTLLKGLIHFRQTGAERHLSFFFLPWVLSWHAGPDPPGSSS